MRFIPVTVEMFGSMNERVAYIAVCAVKSLIWFVPYISLLYLLKIVDFRQFKAK